MKHSYLLSLISFILFLQSLLSCSRQQHYSLSKIAMGTIVTISVDSDSLEKARTAIDHAFTIISSLEELMSPYKPQSDVARINNNTETIINNDTFNVISQSLEISHATGGLFDITFASVGKLWQLQSASFTPPDAIAIKKFLHCVGYKSIRLDAYTHKVIKLKPCVTIGLGGIAKGYAIAQASIALRKNGIREGIVEAGGDLEVIGNNYGYGYTIGIKHPRNEGIIGTVKLYNGQAIATSGDYERYAIYKGTRYHHIFNPKTGYPAQSDIISVSVISNNATICDGYATALFIMGSKQAMLFCKKNPRLALQCIIIDKDLNIHVSQSLIKKVTFPHYSIQSF
ncbi:MAG: FAD:protein FMN transferase [Spirochaetes bacterium]|nr:FAD:protein FMN transferase [Spirochaetota bacterium]